MNKEFEVHLLNAAGKLKARLIAEAFDDCFEKLKSVCPPCSREFEVAKQKLEEACFFAKKSMANMPENTEQ